MCLSSKDEPQSLTPKGTPSPAEKTPGVKVAESKVRRFLWMLIVGSLVFDAACLVASRAAQPPEPLTPTPQIVESVSTEGPRLTPEPQEHDFGIVTQKSSLEQVFRLKNTGSAPLEILSVEASCGCTSTLLSEKVVQPGRTGELKVGFQSGSMEGPFRKKVTVFTNAEEPSTEIFIKGSVQPLFTVDPVVIALGDVQNGKEYRRKVVVQPRREETPFELGKVRCLDPQVRIENVAPLPDGKGASFEMVFTPVSDGWEQGSISYETGHPDMPRGYVRYSGRRKI